MKKLWLGAAAAAFMINTAPAWAETAPTEPAPLAAPRMGPWGFDASGQDKAVKPGDDFYRYANGTWDQRTSIPGDRARFGAFDALVDLSDQRSRAVIEAAAADKAATGDKRLIGLYYRSFMDEARVEALGAKPLERDLAAVRVATTREAIAALMGKQNQGFHGSLFDLSIDDDAKNTKRYAVQLSQGGLGLPDRDYYLTEQFAAKKAQYQTYVSQMLRQASWADPDAAAAKVVDLETRIAQVSWTRVDQRDDTKTYNPMSLDELERAAPGFPWRTFLAAQNLPNVRRLIVRENTAVPKIAAIFTQTPIDTLQAWQAFTTADSAAPFLSKRFVDAQFEFRSKALSGQPEQRARWKRGVSSTGRQIGEAVGKLYVEAYFPPESKTKMEALVGNLTVAMRGRIERVSWMGPDTKARALEKLSKFTVKIGYPDNWRDYSALQLREGDLYGNVERSTSFEWRRQVVRLDQPVDRTEWFMTPQTVNAYYSQTRNEIVFPAAILQPPFFDPQADDAVNYGAIGGVIGHEISHGYDDQGRHSDGDGTLTEWWTPADDVRFTAQAKRLGGQYSAFEPLPGAKVNGELTMGENIGDLGGLLVALDAYHASLGGKAAPVIDGTTGDQRVFLSWAQVWRSKQREDAARQQLAADPHSPPLYRVNGVVRNIDAWYQAFGVQAGDALYTPPDARVRIW